MAVLTFANTKGGAGKTTAVVIVACELARMGFSVAVLDADPQLWISKWHERLGDRAPAALSVVRYVTAANLGQHARKLREEVDFLLIDLPGARSPLLAQAIGYSNYVLIPVQGSAMDAEGATNVIELLQYLDDRAAIRIPHSVVLTRVNPMVTTRALHSVKELLSSRRVHVLSTPIIERAAYREVFGYGQTLYSIDPESVSNLDKAQQNAQALAQEVLRRILPYSGRADQVKGEHHKLSA
ncbi:ParA family protein [Rhizobium sp. P38BS-XIX]|uniref:ParA family protein n=1 Tax=Rhizobium sp. P38BS-XIX TaxID=2726740 RepID=UPI0014564754|nr:ParA family protein [Rhizobium sp. P38BS-XIX]NLR98231.1 ParA family protein [Rhizobium sp. P38BS-XIX]